VTELSFDYATLDKLRQDHPAWRLLGAHHAPLVAGFLHRLFIVPNVRSLSQADLVEALEDELFVLREQMGNDAFPETAHKYLNDWAENDKGWLRKFYPAGTDEPHYDLTPATEKALAWLEGLAERTFVGTESRLLTLLDLLRQINQGSQTDPAIRIAELQKRRDDIDAEILRIMSGDIQILDDAALKDRFQQFVQLSRGLMADFREVEHNFRELDRRVRERIALWGGTKGKLLEEIMLERDAIANSDQGKSFRAFWEFLMSRSLQEELGQLLEQMLSLQPIHDMRPESRLHRVHYDWLEAGEHTQRTVAKLSGQLRRFLDDHAWLENRRIMDILHSIENHALLLRENPPSKDFMPLAETSPTVELPMERPLFRIPIKTLITEMVVDEGDVDVDTASLYDQVVVDLSELNMNIRKELQDRSQVSLSDVIARNPLRNGLAELVAYLQVSCEWARTVFDENVQEQVTWESRDGVTRRATLPRIIFLRA